MLEHPSTKVHSRPHHRSLILDITPHDRPTCFAHEYTRGHSDPSSYPEPNSEIIGSNELSGNPNSELNRKPNNKPNNERSASAAKFHNNTNGSAGDEVVGLRYLDYLAAA